jgi:hypothetical protein
MRIGSSYGVRPFEREEVAAVLPRGVAGGAVDLARLARETAASPEVSASFARAARHPSSNPAITGTFGSAGKAELFAGDLLHAAGLRAPTYETTGWDGAPGLRYAFAERWPRHAHLFETIVRLEDVRPGDLLVVDWRGRSGESGGHIEVITGVEGERITSAGARTRGLVEDSIYGRLLVASRPAGGRFLFEGEGRNDAEIFVLRPRR